MTDSPPDNLTFEQALSELEGIVRALEGGETDLEESLARYERGVTLLKRCYGQLRDAEQRILLLGAGEDGEPAMRPFEHAATLEGGKQRDPRRHTKKHEGRQKTKKNETDEEEGE